MDAIQADATGLEAAPNFWMDSARLEAAPEQGEYHAEAMIRQVYEQVTSAALQGNPLAGVEWWLQVGRWLRYKDLAYSNRIRKPSQRRVLHAVVRGWQRIDLPL